MSRLHVLGASLDRVDGYGVAPLHVAVQSVKIDSLRWLVAHSGRFDSG